MSDRSKYTKTTQKIQREYTLKREKKFVANIALKPYTKIHIVNANAHGKNIFGRAIATAVRSKNRSFFSLVFGVWATTVMLLPAILFSRKKKIMYTQRARTQIKRPLLVSHFNILLVCLGCINVLQNCSKSLCIAICVDGKIQRLQRERYSKQRNANRLKFVRRVSFPNFKWIWMSSSDDQRHLLHSGCSFVGFNGCAGSIAYEKAPNTCDEAQLVDRTTLHTIPSRLPSGFVRTLHC